jgi:BMFP domain-containing protein YqiC
MMICKMVKYGAITAVGAGLVGGVLLGPDLFSYVRSSAHSVQTSVKNSVPITFELQRARDLVDDIIPELHANIRLIAQEEVAIKALNNDIVQSNVKLADEYQRMARLRNRMETQQVSYQFSGRNYSHEQVTKDLSRRFRRYQESEVVLSGKVRLLETRKKSLVAATEMLQRTRDQKATLKQEIESLEAQHRLVQASAVGTNIAIDGSRLSDAQKLIGQIKNRLDVAERVLAHQADFVQNIPIEVVDEQDLLAEMDDYFGGTSPAAEATDESGYTDSELSENDLSLLR